MGISIIVMYVYYKDIAVVLLHAIYHKQIWVHCPSCEVGVISGEPILSVCGLGCKLKCKTHQCQCSTLVSTVKINLYHKKIIDLVNKLICQSDIYLIRTQNKNSG